MEFKPITDVEINKITKGYVMALDNAAGFIKGHIYKIKVVIHEDFNRCTNRVLIEKDSNNYEFNGWHHECFAYLGEELTPAFRLLYDKR